MLGVALHEGNLWVVPGSAKLPYKVFVRDDGWTCTCPDWRYKPKTDKGVRVCKHIGRVVYASGEVPVLVNADPAFMQEYLQMIREE